MSADKKLRDLQYAVRKGTAELKAAFDRIDDSEYAVKDIEYFLAELGRALRESEAV